MLLYVVVCCCMLLYVVVCWTMLNDVAWWKHNSSSADCHISIPKVMQNMDEYGRHIDNALISRELTPKWIFCGWQPPWQIASLIIVIRPQQQKMADSRRLSKLDATKASWHGVWWGLSCFFESAVLVVSSFHRSVCRCFGFAVCVSLDCS